MRSFEIISSPTVATTQRDLCIFASLAEEKPSFDSNRIQPKSIPLIFSIAVSEERVKFVARLAERCRSLSFTLLAFLPHFPLIHTIVSHI